MEQHRLALRHLDQARDLRDEMHTTTSRALVRPTLVGILILFICAAVWLVGFGQMASFAQTVPPTPIFPTPVAPPAAAPYADLDVITKIAGAVITGLATIFGLPLVLLTYKRTRAEIVKINLEAASLREKLPPHNDQQGIRDEAGTRISVDHSPNVHVEVVFDPRFLIPLLLMLDFIFAWIVLTLADGFLGLLQLGFIAKFFLPILAALLLLPIAREVIRARAFLRPPQSPTEISAATKQARIAAYGSYAMVTLGAIGFGLLLMFAISDPVINIFAWVLLGIASLLVVAAPFLKNRTDRYIYGLIKPGDATK
jgi:hypothetical protein